MADQTQHTVKMIEQTQVSPPPSSVPSTSLPLTFFDPPWLFCVPIQRIFFYDFPHPSHHFLQTVLPKLKHSLSLTLQHFFPYASTFVLPPKPHLPYLRYTDGGSVPFSVAESTADFGHLVSHSPKDVTLLHPFIPTLTLPRELEDGTRLFSPIMAIQVTILPNSGFSLCVTFLHVIGDGSSFHHFMKFWASVCSETGDSSLSLPIHNRNIVEDQGPKGLTLLNLEELWNSSEKSFNINISGRVSSDKVRFTYVLGAEQVQKLKQWVSLKCSSYNSETSNMHISSFVVVCSFIWVCKLKSEKTNAEDVRNSDKVCNLIFMGDCRNRPGLSIPPSYFGNCLAPIVVAIKSSELMEENGVVKAAIGIESKVRDFLKEPLKGIETVLLVRVCREVALGGSTITIAGSPKLGVYNTDFGWGKPKKSEVLHIEDSGSICLSDSRNMDGGIEFGLVLGRTQVNKFSTILEEQLRNVTDFDQAY